MIVAAIPVKNNIHWTAPLVEHLLYSDEVDEIWVYDNGSTDDTKDWITNRSNISNNRLKYFDASSMRFYDMWNHMIKRASRTKGTKLAILNNDIRLPRMALKTMADNIGSYKIAQVDGRLRSFDNATPVAVPIRWTERIGHAFMLDADFWADQEYAVSPEFKLWYGDDDLFLRCYMRGGEICEIRGLGCDHAWRQSYQYYLGDVEKDIQEDRKTFLKIWGVDTVQDLPYNTQYDNYTVYLTIIGSRGMQSRSWNGHSAEIYMPIPDLSEEKIKKYIMDSMILEWKREKNV